MTDDFDRKLAEMMQTAEPSPPLRPGWQARTLAALARVGSGPAPARGWIATAVTVLLVVLALIFVPYSTAGSRPMGGGSTPVAAALAAEAVTERPAQASRGLAPGEQPEEEKQLAPYRRRAVEFVESRYPNDPDMILAAGMLTDDSKAGLALLKKAVDISDSPAAWSAYAGRLRESGPPYDRLGSGGGDPGDPEQIADARRRMAEVRLPERLSAQETAPILAALKAWEALEPDNALPLMVETYCLYGLHEDAQALARWRQAAALPKVDTHQRDLLRVAGLLLTRMGMRPFDAISVAHMTAPATYQYFALLRQCARIAQWEGRLAHIEGRPKDAIAWWNGTIGFGQHMMGSADSLIPFLVGIAIEGIGASPTWRWFPDRDPETGIARGPLLGGRILYGEQHAFYVSQVGEAADAKVRDQLVLSKVQSMLLRDPKVRNSWSPQMRFLKPLGAALLAAMLLAALLVVFAAFGTWRRRQADGATSLPLAWRLAIVILVLAPLAVAAAVYEPSVVGPARSSPRVLGACLGTAFTLAILLPLVAALMGRQVGARLRTAWRGNLRRMLPITIAVCAVLSLSLGITGKVMQVSWTRQWLKQPPNEMAWVIQQLGPAWTHPRIPPDSWRAQNPPQPYQ